MSGIGVRKYPTIAPPTHQASDNESPPVGMTVINKDNEDVDNTPGVNDDNDKKSSRLFEPVGRFDDPIKSVHYGHRTNGYSCHSPVKKVSLLGQTFKSICHHNTIPPPWVHVFSKSTHPSSLQTQAASIAHMEQPVHKKARHRRNRRSMKKLLKQKQLLTEIIVPECIEQNILAKSQINNEIVVVDGGDDGNLSIVPTDGVIWHSLSVRVGNHLHVQDESNPSRGLTFPRVDGALPFIRIPQKNSLAITRKITMKDIVAALEECERLKKTPLIRSDRKRIFGDYGRPVMYTSAGVQVSRNSPEVLNCKAFLQNLPTWHWTILMKKCGMRKIVLNA